MNNQISNLKDKKSLSFLTFFAVFLPALFLYALTAGRTVYWHDSGIYLTVLHCMGVPYEPGFPFYLIAAKPFTWLAPIFGYALSVHLFSGVCAAVACGIIALLVLRITSMNRWAALFAGWSMAGSYTLWFQAINAEVYASFVLFLAALLYIILTQLPDEKHKKENKVLNGKFLILCGVYGLSFGNHPMTAAFFPLFLFSVWRVWKLNIGFRNLLYGGIVFTAAGFLPFLILPILATRDPYLVQGNVLSLSGFFHHITATTFVSNESNFSWSWARAMAIPKEIFLQFFVMGLILSLIGIREGRKIKTLIPVLALAACPITFLAIIYSKGFEWDMWLLGAYVPIVILMGIGFDWILGKISTGSLRKAAGIALIGSVLIPQGIVNFPLLNRSDDYLPEDYGKNLLRNLDQNSVFVVRTDSACSTVAYCQEVLDFRKDVTAVWEPYLPSLWYRQFLNRKTGISLALDKEKIPLKNAIALLAGQCRQKHRPLFFITIPQVGPMKDVLFEPAGTSFKLVDAPGKSIDLRYWNRQYTNPDWKERKARNHAERVSTDRMGKTTVDRAPYHQDVIDFEIQGHLNLARVFFAGKKYLDAVKEYKKAMELAGPEPFIAQKIAESYYLGRDSRAEAALKKAVEQDSNYIAGVFYLGEWARVNGQMGKARSYYEAAVKTRHPMFAKAAAQALASLGK